MKSIRESRLLGSNKRLTERKSIVGAFNAFDKDIFRDKIWYPHEEMASCVDMYNRNSYAQSAVNTMKDFIKGGDLVVKSKDKKTQLLAQSHIEELDVDTWIDEVIENTIKTGNGYLEIDYSDAEWKNPERCYPLPDSSRIYINCDEYGLPKKEEIFVTDPYTKEPQKVIKRNEEEFFVQRVDTGFRHAKAKWYDMSYHVGFQFHKFRIYGIPINKRKMIHFKLNIGDNGLYGRSYLASALDDFETLKQIERSIAIIAKYKAVPRDIIMYGDKDNPATDDELDEFIIYLESLEKDESAIVNKPIKRESLAYAGQDINLDYMINHVSKKIIAGIAPDFMMGMGDQVNKATAQITLISYILAIYSKRRLFLKPIERYILKPFLRKNGLSEAHLEFGELDFETKSEKVNRVGALWTQNLLTFNEAREELGYNNIGDIGDVYYLEWQNSMMDSSNGFGFPQLNAPPEEEMLPNGEPKDQMFTHQEPPNKKLFGDGGKDTKDTYQKKANETKFLPKKDMSRPGEENAKNIKHFFKTARHTKEQVRKNYDKVEMPQNYNLEATRDYGTYVEKKDVQNQQETGERPKQKIWVDGKYRKVWDGKKYKKVWKPGHWIYKKSKQSIDALYEATMTIEIPDIDNPKVKKISFETLMSQFGAMFEEPRLTEIFYMEIEGGWRLSFEKGGMIIVCDVLSSDIVDYHTTNDELSEEEAVGLIIAWHDKFLIKGIREE